MIGSYIQVFFNTILIGQLIYYYQKNKKESLNEMISKNQDKNISEIVVIEETSRSFTDIKKDKKENIIDCFVVVNKN